MTVDHLFLIHESIYFRAQYDSKCLWQLFFFHRESQKHILEKMSVPYASYGHTFSFCLKKKKSF